MNGYGERVKTAHLVYEVRQHMKIPNRYNPRHSAPCLIPYPQPPAGLMLGKVLLEEYLPEVKPVPDAAGIWNQFVWNYLQPGVKSETTLGVWLNRESGLEKSGMWQINPVQGRKPFEIGLLLLRLFQRAGMEGLQESDAMTAETDEGTVGYVDGKVLTTFPGLEPDYEPCDLTNRLSRLKTYRGARSYNATFNRIWVNAHRHELRDALTTALAILFWKTSCSAQRTAKLFYPL